MDIVQVNIQKSGRRYNNSGIRRTFQTPEYKKKKIGIERQCTKEVKIVMSKQYYKKTQKAKDHQEDYNFRGKTV